MVNYFLQDNDLAVKYFFNVVCKLKNIFPSLHPQNILKTRTMLRIISHSKQMSWFSPKGYRASGGASCAVG